MDNTNGRLKLKAATLEVAGVTFVCCMLMTFVVCRWFLILHPHGLTVGVTSEILECGERQLGNKTVTLISWYKYTVNITVDGCYGDQYESSWEQFLYPERLEEPEDEIWREPGGNIHCMLLRRSESDLKDECPDANQHLYATMALYKFQDLCDSTFDNWFDALRCKSDASKFISDNEATIFFYDVHTLWKKFSNTDRICKDIKTLPNMFTDNRMCLYNHRRYKND